MSVNLNRSWVSRDRKARAGRGERHALDGLIAFLLGSPSADSAKNGWGSQNCPSRSVLVEVCMYSIGFS